MFEIKVTDNIPPPKRKPSFTKLTDYTFSVMRTIYKLKVNESFIIYGRSRRTVFRYVKDVLFGLEMDKGITTNKYRIKVLDDQKK